MQGGRSLVNLNEAALETSMTTDLVNRIHNMSWLKQNSSMQKENMQRFANDQKMISVKKTDEDYFCGTKKEKKKKKRKEEKEGKGKLKEVSKVQEKLHEKKRTEISEIPLNSAADVNFGKSVWSLDTNVADKLFPNVQSVKIDRAAEEEMLSHALAESIATVQLEQFNRFSPAKENRWEALYGDDDDEGWDNVRRNMPSAIEKAINEVSCRRKSCKDNVKIENNNTCPKPGILRHRKVNNRTAKTENLDFCFKKKSSMSEEEIVENRSARVVVFNESIDVKIASSDSSDEGEKSKYHPIKSDATLSINESKSPNIDKYGRLDGYSERRLFMGKGARMKEQQYIERKKCSVSVGDIRCQDSVPNKTSSKKVMQTNNVQKSKTDKTIVEVGSVEKSDQTVKKSLFVKDAKASVVEELNRSVLEPSNNYSSEDLSLDQSSCVFDTPTKSVMNCSTPRKSGAETSGKTENKIYAPNEVKLAEKICDRNRNVINQVSKITEPSNMHRVQSMLSSTQTSIPKMSENGTESNVPKKESTHMQNLQEERKDQKLGFKICHSAGNVTESEVQGDKFDPEVKYGVWAMMRDNPCPANISATNLEYTDSAGVIQNPEPPCPPPYQRSYLEFMKGIESNLDPQNLLVQNINCRDTQNQDLVALHDKFSPHQNAPINQLSNHNAYGVLDYHPNVVNPMQLQQREYAYSVSQIDPQYLPCQNFGPMINSPCDPLNYVQDSENVFSNMLVDNASQLVNNNILPPCDSQACDPKQIRFENTTHRWIKNDKLPPGFAKHRAIRKNDDEYNRMITNSLLVDMSINNGEEVQKTESNRQHNDNYRAEKRSSHSNRNNAAYCETRANNSNTHARKQNCKLPPKFQNQGARRPTNLLIPHPILGASVHRQDLQDKTIEMDNGCKKLNLNGNSESNRNEGSSIMPNPVERIIENSMPPVYNNNYFIQNRQSPILESKSPDPRMVPISCHPHHPPSFNNIINWQHEVNMMDPNQQPVTLDPRIQIMQNAIPIASGIGFPQCQSNVMSLGYQTPLYTMPPPNINANAGHDVQNLQQSNIAFQTNAYHFVGLRQSQESQETARPLLNHCAPAVGRGRGRLTKREL